MAKFLWNVEEVEVLNQKSATDHSDSDWLSIVVSVGGADGAKSQTFKKVQNIGRIIHTGDILKGPWISDPVEVGETDFVTVTYVIMNLSFSSDADQLNDAVDFAAQLADKVTPIYLKIVGGVLASAGGIVGTPAAAIAIEGAASAIIPQLSDQVSSVVDDVIAPFVKKLIGIVVGIIEGPNCNGEVARLTPPLVFGPRQFRSGA